MGLKNTLRYRHEGFSLLEIVVAVSILLVLSVVGFIAYQGFTDNARQAAVERAAHDVFTASVAALNAPEASAVSVPAPRSDGLQLVSHTVPAKPRTAQVTEQLKALVYEYNMTAGDEIHVTFALHEDALTITALGWENQYTAVRSTDNSMDGQHDTPADGEDIVDTSGGVLRFVTSAPHSTIYLSDFGEDGVTLQFSDDEEKPLEEGVITLPERGQYTIRGTFSNIGHIDTQTNIASVDIWENTNTLNASHTFDGNGSNIVFNTVPPATILDMNHMFNDAYVFNQDISEWNMTNVTDTHEMFHNARSFNNGGRPLDWDGQMAGVTRMDSMFDDAYAFNQDVSGWDVSDVTTMRQMFLNTKAFNNGGKPLDWGDKTHNVMIMEQMFQNTQKFDQDISGWNVANVQEMDYMFDRARVFNNAGQPLDWGAQTGNVRLIEYMFYNTPAFNQDLSGWDMSSVVQYHNFTGGTSILESRYLPTFP